MEFIFYESAHFANFACVVILFFEVSVSFSLLTVTSAVDI